MAKLYSIHIEFTLQYIALTNYYIVKDTFRRGVMTDNTINVKTKKWSEQNYKIVFNILRIHITIHHTYQLLYHKGHILMTSNDNTINVKKNNNRTKWQN